MTGTSTCEPLDLRAARQASALAAGEVAVLLGVHPTTVTRWERRDRFPAPQHLHALASAYDVSVAAVSAYFDEARCRMPRAEDDCPGRGLRRLRDAHGITASELANRVAVPVHTVYNWESGTARVPRRQIQLLAEVFSMAVDEVETSLRRGPAPVTLHSSAQSPLRRLRVAAGQSQEQLSRSAGVARSSLRAWEHGVAPGLSAIRGLARALDLPAVELARRLGVDLPRELVPAAWRPGDLPAVLRVLRLWSRLTQAELARHCGCSSAAVRSWERGRSRPSERLRERLELLYRLPPDALLLTYPCVERLVDREAMSGPGPMVKR